MSNTLPGLRRARTAASSRMTKLATAARGRSMTDDEQHDFDAAASDVASLDEKIAAAEAETTEVKDKTVGRAEAAEIVKLCVDGGVPMMASTLLAEGVSVEVAKTRIAAVGEAKAMVTGARRVNGSIPEDFAATMLAEGKSVDQIRAALFEKMVAADEKSTLVTHAPPAGGGTTAAKPVDLVADMKRRYGVKA